MTPDQARETVRAALLRIVPDADLDSLAPTTELRDALELDSLDFLSFVEMLSGSSGRRIDEDDYPQLETMDSCVAFLAEAAPSR